MVRGGDRAAVRLPCAVDVLGDRVAGGQHDPVRVGVHGGDAVGVHLRGHAGAGVMRRYQLDPQRGLADTARGGRVGDQVTGEEAVALLSLSGVGVGVGGSGWLRPVP